MKKRITVIAATLALLTLTAASGATAGSLSSVSGSGGVLVRHDDGYIITGTLRDADSQVVGTIHGTLVELTTGFNSCPYLGANAILCVPLVGPPPACNLLGGEVRLNFQGTEYETVVSTEFVDGRVASALCKDADDPAKLFLMLFMWIRSAFPSLSADFTLHASVQQISPNVWRWSS
jgi:hypothetical protein